MDSRGAVNNLVTGEYLVWNNATASFLPEQLGLSSIRSSVHIQIRFSNSLSSFFCFVFLSLHVLRMRHFVSLLGTVTCGVHSVLNAGGNVRGAISSRRGLLSVLLLVG